MAGWRARPIEAAVVRALVVVVPVGAAMAAAAVMSRSLTWPAPRSLPWWAAVLGGSVLVSLVVGRLARRLLPLAALLRLSLVFPDRTPSRFHVALRAGSVRKLEREVARVRAEGVGDDVDVAAETVLVLAAALNAHDPLTRGHSERVRGLAEMLARELHLSEDDVQRLRWSALLHDCGKLIIPGHVLRKTGPLEPDDWELVRRHPMEGAKLTAPLRGWLGPWAAAIEEHHERWDGEGYPNGLRGDTLSFGARIVAVADAYEVMTAARTYKTPLSPAAARAELTANAGTQFDPEVVRALLRVSLGRAGWVASVFSWFGGMAVIRSVGARTPKDAPNVGLTAAAFAGLALLGLLAPSIGAVADPGAAVAAPRRRPPAVAPALAAEVLGVQFEPPAPPPPPAVAAPPRRAPTIVVPSSPPSPPAVAPPTTSVPPATVVPAPSDACTAQAQLATGSTPAALRLLEVRAGKADHNPKNPNCAPVPPGS